MKAFAATLLFASVSAFAENRLYAKFLQWISDHGRNYGTLEEFKTRFDNFIITHKTIEEFNRKDGQTSTIGHNNFSDWTAEEKKTFFNWKPKKDLLQAPKVLPTADLPSEVNWVDKGAVNPIQDQGNCGSCWAFSAVAAMEGQHFVQTGDLVKVSEQQCVDCDTDSYGCSGGW